MEAALPSAREAGCHSDIPSSLPHWHLPHTSRKKSQVLSYSEESACGVFQTRPAGGPVIASLRPLPSEDTVSHRLWAAYSRPPACTGFPVYVFFTLRFSIAANCPCSGKQGGACHPCQHICSYRPARLRLFGQALGSRGYICLTSLIEALCPLWQLVGAPITPLETAVIISQEAFCSLYTNGFIAA